MAGINLAACVSRKVVQRFRIGHASVEWYRTQITIPAKFYIQKVVRAPAETDTGARIRSGVGRGDASGSLEISEQLVDPGFGIGKGCVGILLAGGCSSQFLADDILDGKLALHF